MKSIYMCPQWNDDISSVLHVVPELDSMAGRTILVTGATGLICSAVMDVLIGFTVGLHIVCFKEQTGNYQTDINSHPLFFSYLYITTVLLFDICLILLSYEPSLNIFYAFKTLGVDLWNDIAMLWK